MSQQNSRSAASGRSSDSTRSVPRRSPARRGLQVETLESRQLMAADAVESLTFEALAEDPVALDADSAAATPSLFALDVALFSEPGAVEVAAFSASALVPPDATDGKTSISFRDEPFANFAGGFGNVRYVKGHILLSDPNTVYFQDSVKYLYHYDFAAARLDPFLNMTRDQFDAVSLRRAGQQVVMVSVLMSPDRQELAVQFVGADAYPREDVAAWMRTVAAAVQSDSPPALLYMPTYEQSAAAQADLAWFASQQITVTDASRWMRGDVTYAEGWATGRLVRVPAAEIPAAYGDGRLRPTDILLLTDGVPAEVPFVRGIVTLTPATPNSHVAILARNQEIPFVWVQDAAERQRVAALEGKSVLLRADQGRIAVSPLDTPLEPSSVADWLTAQQTPAPANIVPRAPYGQWLEDATDLTPAEIRYFGGKASNYGLLRRTIPDNSQRAMAFSFDLWDAFMTNVNPATGRTLREEIDLRLGSFSYPPDMTLARQKLAEVNTLIRKTVKWTDAQRSQILAELIAGFPDVPHDKFLRFRSSSNAEDSQELTGAGLYDSFSGCIADDTDNDTKGPSRADPNEPDEKGVFRAIEKVFASFYNENAWLERLRHSVREQDTGMAILVHQNFPDALEMANGVVTFKYQRSQFGDQQEVNYSASIVTQLGALSVTNPEGGAIAEEVAAFFSPGLDPYLYVRTPSTLVPLGTTVMDWQNDYPELMRLIAQVAEGYADLYPQKDEFTLDLEFKRMIPGKLIVKQVREIPTHEIEMVAPQLINENTEWRVLQSEFSDVWAHHRLKSQLSLSTINGPMASGTNPLKSIDLSLLDGTGLGAQPLELEGAPSALPGYSFTSGEGNFVNSFRLGSGAAARDVQLTTNYPALVDKNAAPVITSRDFTQQLEVRYTTPVPWTTPAGPAARYVDQVQLVPAEQLAPADELQTRSWTFGDVTITTRFHYARVGDAMLIKTLPLGSWVDTEIKGLTTEPIRLTSDYSQTYGPGHHNFNEQFLFEPGLDASLTPTQRAELAAKNVRMLHVYFDRLAEGMPGSRTQNLTIFGLDGASRAGSTLTLPDVTLNVGRSVSLVARGADMNGDSIVFRDATWETTGGGTIVRQGARSVFTAQQAGVFELTATDPQHPGIVARARVLVTGVTLDNDATLRVVGGSGNDQVTIEQVGDSELRVRVNFLTGARRVQSFPLEQIVRVEVYGGAGRDVVNASNVSLPVTIEGGAGDDVLRGGAGDDLLFGGIGDDRIWGGLGDDILAGGAGLDTLRGDDGRNLVIGGAGRDQLVGGNTGEDILIGGNTAFSDPAAGFGVDILALRSLLDEWKSAHDSAARKSNLLSGDGGEDRLNDDYFLILGVTVFNDGQRDSIVRGNRRNWKW